MVQADTSLTSGREASSAQVLLPRLVVITREYFFAGEASICRALFALGLPILHLRKPGAGISELRRFLEYFDSAERQRITLHLSVAGEQSDVLDCCAVSGIGGIHGSLQTPLSGVRRSRSLHWDDLEVEAGCYDYVFLGPFFPSISKPGYGSGAPPLPRERPHSHILALGGVTPERLAHLPVQEVDGVACCGYVWESEDPIGAFRRLQKAAALW